MPKALSAIATGDTNTVREYLVAIRAVALCPQEA